LLSLFEIVLDVSEAVERAFDAVSLHADGMEAGDEVGVLEANEVFGTADCLLDVGEICAG
jgi:hypothetical protein